MSEHIARVWDRGLYANVSVCCEDMVHAFQRGTDNEGYGTLASIWGDEIHLGSIRKEIQYCPWCGSKQEDRHE